MHLRLKKGVIEIVRESYRENEQEARTREKEINRYNQTEIKTDREKGRMRHIEKEKMTAKHTFEHTEKEREKKKEENGVYTETKSEITTERLVKSKHTKRDKETEIMR